MIGFVSVFAALSCSNFVNFTSFAETLALFGFVLFLLFCLIVE